MAAEDPGAPPWSRDAGGVTLSVRLTPRAVRDGVDGASSLSDGRPVILARVRAVAEKGKANEAARKLLARTADVSPSRVKLIAGASARVKLFRIVGEPGAIVAALEDALEAKEPTR